MWYTSAKMTGVTESPVKAEIRINSKDFVQRLQHITRG